MKTLFFKTIIQNDIKTAGHGDDQLMKRLVSMPATFGTAGDVVEIVDPINIKWDMPSAPLNKGQVTAGIGDLGKLYDPAIIQGIHSESSRYLMMRPGFPTTTALGGTSLVTTVPAPIMAPAPMVIPHRIVALAPIDAPLCTTVELS